MAFFDVYPGHPNERIHLHLDGEPLAKARHRSRIQGSKIMTYDAQSKSVKSTKEKLRSMYLGEPIKLPMRVTVLFYLEAPKAISRKKYPNYLVPHVVRPDLDNLVKYILDCMIGIVIEDDKYIYQITSKKYYAYHARTEIFIETDYKPELPTD